jgi:hypothetical protein
LHADNTETGGDEDKIRKQIDYSKSRWIFQYKVLSIDRYMKDCHSEALQMHNNGGFTLLASGSFTLLVAEAYNFQFGLSLMKVIVYALMQQPMKDEGDAYVKNAQQCV